MLLKGVGMMREAKAVRGSVSRVGLTTTELPAWARKRTLEPIAKALTVKVTRLLE